MWVLRRTCCLNAAVQEVDDLPMGDDEYEDQETKWQRHKLRCENGLYD